MDGATSAETHPVDPRQGKLVADMYDGVGVFGQAPSNVSQSSDPIEVGVSVNADTQNCGESE